MQTKLVALALELARIRAAFVPWLSATALMVARDCQVRALVFQIVHWGRARWQRIVLVVAHMLPRMMIVLPEPCATKTALGT
jgi:hypothetical protein